MSWETTGTVKVTNNSAAVTGFGTLFTAKSRIGDAFIGPDGALYEVKNVVSDVLLNISPPYLGATASGAAYKIAPIRGYQKLAADRLYHIVNTIDDTIVLVSNLPEWIKNNSPVPVEAGGTGGITAATGRAGLGLGNSATRDVGTTTGAVAAGDDSRILGSFQKSNISHALGNSQDKVVSQDALTKVLGALNPVPSSFTWNEKTDTKVYHYYNPLNAPQEHMRRCVQNDALEVVYYLDPFDSSKKEDGTPSDLSGADGQVMVEIPQTFVSARKVGDNITWSSSLVPIPGLVLHPAFLEGGELYFDVSLGFYYYKNVTKVHDFIYYSAYMPCVEKADGSYIGGLNLDNNDSRLDYSLDKLASVSGGYLMAGVTRPQIRQLATNRGTGWQGLDFWTVALTQFLYTTEYGELNTQATIGNGNTSSSYPASSAVQADSPHSQAGKSNSIGNATGHLNSPAKDTAWMSYRGIEHWYGNAWQSLDGVVFSSRQPFVSNTPSEFGDTTANHASIGGPLPESGYIRTVQHLTLSFLPSSNAGGGSVIAFSDYVYTNTGVYVGWFGGAANNGALAGGFCRHADNSVGSRDRSRCARFINKK
jgi:hypothetical protein